jgi:cytochrome c biogenesis protein CcdA
MKKLVSNLNPFILLLVPVVFALVLGVSYQFEQAEHFADSNSLTSVKHATSLFSQGIHLVKAVCSVSVSNLW